MKKPAETGDRWLREAAHTLQQAKLVYKNKIYNVTCFLAEQACQKALKAVLYFEGARFITMHSIAELLKEVSKKHPELSRFIAQGGHLDQYYLSSRYPDAVAEPAIPSEIFDDEQAAKALSIAEEIFMACKKLVRLSKKDDELFS